MTELIPEDPKRDQLVYDLVKKGLPYEYIGKVELPKKGYKQITKQRIEQIFNKIRKKKELVQNDS